MENTNLFSVNVILEDNSSAKGNLIQNLGNYKAFSQALLGNHPTVGANGIDVAPCVMLNKNAKNYVMFTFHLNGVRRGISFISTTKDVVEGESTEDLSFGLFDIKGEVVPLAYKSHALVGA